MTDILAITGPIFLLIALGFAGARAGILKRQSVDGLGAFIFFFALPAVVVRALVSTDLYSAVEPWFMLAYSLGGVLSFTLVCLIVRYLKGKPLTESAYFGLGAALPNTIIVGYPLLTQLGLPGVVEVFSMALIVENILMIPLALLVLESGGRDAGLAGLAVARQIARRMLTNPIIIAIIAGVVLSLLSIQLPSILDKSLNVLAGATSGACLIFVGAVLGTSEVGNRFGDVGIIAVAKLLIHPLVMVAVVMLLPDFATHLQKAVILIAALPMFTIYPLFGSRHGLAQLGASALVVATASSFVTVSVALYFLF